MREVENERGGRERRREGERRKEGEREKVRMMERAI